MNEIIKQLSETKIDEAQDIYNNQYLVNSLFQYPNLRDSVIKIYFPARHFEHGKKHNVGQLYKIMPLNDTGLWDLGIAWPCKDKIKDNVVILNAHLLDNGFQTDMIVKADPVDMKTVHVAKRIKVSIESEADEIDIPSIQIYVSEFLYQVEYVRKGAIFRNLQFLNKMFDIHLLGCETDTVDIFQVKESTRYDISSQEAMKKASDNQDDNIPKMGGMDNLLNEAMHLFTKSQRLAQYKINPVKGIILHGPPGTGKTLFARTLCKLLKYNLFTINGPEIIGQYYGETEQRLRSIFKSAAESAPSIIFIDEMESLCPKRENSSELEKRIVATLLVLLDGMDSKSLNSDQYVYVIGATNRPNDIDPALRRPGRFDKEIEIGIPHQGQRLDILKMQLSSIPNSLSSEEMEWIANVTHGFVGADLSALIREAGFHLSKTKESITIEDIKESLKIVRPSAMREVFLEIPKVKWTDIGGYSDVKQKLKESVEWPLTHPDAFIRMGIKPPKGILLYGPPGCSKTMMAKALATEAGLNFLAIKGPEIFNKYVGESEKTIRDIFKKARLASPSIIFIDEIDALTMKRGSGETVSDRVLTQLLNEMDGIESLEDVTILGATNIPDAIDPALLRPGRMDRILYIGPPDSFARAEIFKNFSKTMPFDSSVSKSLYISLTEGFSGAESVSLLQQSGLIALEEDLNATKITSVHLEKARKSMHCRITKEMIGYYRNFEKGFQRL